MIEFSNQSYTAASVAVSLSVVSLFSAHSVQAATLAQSTGGFAFANFSHTPLLTASSTKTFTRTISGSTDGSSSVAIATADAIFDAFPTAQAINTISNTTFTTNNLSSALAESEASIIGDFVIAPEEAFSFDFFGFIDLLSVTEDPDETATAALGTQYSIFSTEEDDTAVSEIDFLNLFGQINTPEGADDLGVTSSEAVTIDFLEIDNTTGPDKSIESISIQVAGSYERVFDKATNLTLAELKIGTAESGTSQEVPEPASALVWMLGMGGAMLLARQRAILNQPRPQFTQCG